MQTDILSEWASIDPRNAPWYVWAIAVSAGVFLLSLIAAGLRSRIRASVIPAALQLVDEGKSAEARKLLEHACDVLPSAEVCEGRDAHERFQVVVLLADVARKHLANPEYELSLLDEALRLRKKLPSNVMGEPGGSSDWYLLHMNRAIAASKLGQFDVSIYSFKAAEEAAVTVPTRCKALAYLGFDHLKKEKSGDNDLARLAFSRFDTVSTGGQVAAALHSLVLEGQAVLTLKRNDLAAAIELIDCALKVEPRERLSRARKLLVEPGITAQEVVDFILGAARGDLSEPPRRSKPAGTNALPALDADI